MFTATLSPESVEVRQQCNVAVALTFGDPFTPDDVLQVQFPNTWLLVNGPSFTRELQTEDPSALHYICAQAEDAEFAIEIEPSHLNFPEGSSRHGRLFTIRPTAGCLPAGVPLTVGYYNTFAPYVAETETLWVRLNGQPPERTPELVTTPGPHTTMRVLAPSSARPGEPFEVLVVSLDEFENASKTTFTDESLVCTDGQTSVNGLTFTGSVRVPVTLQAEGVFRFRMGETVSNAVRVNAGSSGPYWGDLHIHTKLSHDAQGTDPYVYARNVSGLEFGAVADHWESMGPEGYRIVERWAKDAQDPGRFVAVLADERNPRKLMGHHNIYCRTIKAFRAQQVFPDSPEKQDRELEAERLRDLPPEDVMLVPHHTGIQFGPLPKGRPGNGILWDAWDDPGLRPVMEIYSHHGQSETYAPQHVLAYEFNRMRNPERRANTSIPGPHYAQDYWMAGKRIGVIGSSDEHSGQGGRRHGGLAAVWAEELDCDHLFSALRKRQCYATTGERILLNFTANSAKMGECFSCPSGSEIELRLDVWGTDLLVRVEILRFRFGVDTSFVPIVALAPRPESMDATIIETDTITGPAMYYARALQEPLPWPAMAWTSPIWVEA